MITEQRLSEIEARIKQTIERWGPSCMHSDNAQMQLELIRLARLGLLMEWTMPKVHQAYHEGEFTTCQKATCSQYHKALAQLPKQGEE